MYCRSDIFYWCIYSDIFIFVLVSQGDQQAFTRVIFNYFRFDPNNDVLLFRSDLENNAAQRGK